MQAFSSDHALPPRVFCYTTRFPVLPVRNMGDSMLFSYAVHYTPSCSSLYACSSSSECHPANLHAKHLHKFSFLTTPTQLPFRLPVSSSLSHFRSNGRKVPHLFFVWGWGTGRGANVDGRKPHIEGGTTGPRKSVRQRGPG